MFFQNPANPHRYWLRGMSCLLIAYPLERYLLPAGTVSPTRWNGMERYLCITFLGCWNGINREASGDCPPS